MMPNPSNESVHIVTFDGPEWSVIVGVFVGGNSRLRALWLKKKMEAGEEWHRLDKSWHTDTYKSLSTFEIQERKME